jgi:hypothetical protein
VDDAMAYVGRAGCGCIRAVIVDLPSDPSLTARETARMIEGGLIVERITCEAVRAAPLTRPDCEVHAIAPRQAALL